ncbi:leader peptidase (prepilin peptidase)/N-methyltransferase [Peribacillus deserti]|uniref:Leader peptidase (Prepilin peptidase)/N-methyltransferase n=1 Tax=Peribacillus deserti TaxID=673318 RepID=A0ABS2QFK4_9BACI|nr:A24 family peptidase [Peribacillus deserti]MBM7691929.1 leader peptidase (prepilin peptidase)/N-methyltransferase [Peribacillus deserti]
MFFLIVYFFTIGSVLGSFYNVAGLRIPLKKSIVKPRSQCPFCTKTLGPHELIPVVSYLLQRGKCRRCGSTIHYKYPLIELTTGALFAYCFYKWGFNYELFVALTFVSLLVIILVSDITYMVIPDKVLLFFLPILAIERMLVPLTPWWDSIWGAVFGFSLLLLIAIVSKGGMGGGDIKLFFLIGIVLGLKLTLLAFFLSTLFGALAGIAGIIIGRVKKRQPIPFGPFIVAGSLTAYFYGWDLLSIYMNLLLK